MTYLQLKYGGMGFINHKISSMHPFLSKYIKVAGEQVENKVALIVSDMYSYLI